MIKTSKAKQKTPIVSLAAQIVEKSNEPMSLDEIVQKFNPGFPFSARRVSCGSMVNIFSRMRSENECSCGRQFSRMVDIDGQTSKGVGYVGSMSPDGSACQKCGHAHYMQNYKNWILV